MSRSIARSIGAAGARALAGWLAAAALGAGAAQAARVVDVRVGRHPDFVRVVFETDAPAAFVVERGEPGESRVRIEAAAAPGAVSAPPGSGAEVLLEPLPGGGTLARIRAAAPVRIESQVLDRPPRIVFDLRPSAAQAAQAAPGEAAPEPSRIVPAPRARFGEAPEPAGAEPSGPSPAAESPAAPPEPEAAAPAEPAPPSTALAPEVENPPILPELGRPLAESPELEIPVAEPLPAPARVAPAPPAQAARPPEPETPPVSAAPPVAIVPRLDQRSLLLGAASGLALGLGVALVARGRRARPAAPVLPEIPVASIEEAGIEEALAAAPDERAATHEAAPEAERPPLRMAPWPDSEPLAADLLTMIQRLDERCAGAEQALAALGERTERLERRSGAEAEELASQRVALARLDRALGRPPSPS